MLGEIAGLLRAQQSGSGSATAGQALARLFEPANRNRRLQALSARSPIAMPWEHDFCCLALPGQKVKPSPLEASELRKSGLGKKKVKLSRESTHLQLCQALYTAFPPLQYAGGFKLYKANRASELVEIPMPPDTGYSVGFLRTDSELNRAVAYIVPVQQRLEAMAGQVPVVSEELVIVCAYRNVCIVVHTVNIVSMFLTNPTPVSA